MSGAVVKVTKQGADTVRLYTVTDGKWSFTEPDEDELWNMRIKFTNDWVQLTKISDALGEALQAKYWNGSYFPVVVDSFNEHELETRFPDGTPLDWSLFEQNFSPQWLDGLDGKALSIALTIRP